MNTIFVGGSISIKELPAPVQVRLTTIVSHGYRIVVGDAGGVDYAVQKFLGGYPEARVYCTQYARNNTNGYPEIRCQSPVRPGSRDFYTEKDRWMVHDSTHGLFVWNGFSPGTLRNVLQMALLGKPSVVYVRGAFHNIHNVDDLRSLVGAGSPLLRIIG